MLVDFVTQVSTPTIFYIFLGIGIVGILTETLNPGLLLPGAQGAIFVVFALIGFETIPVNWAPAAFFTAATILMIAEIFISGSGVLAISAILSFIVGLLFLPAVLGNTSSELTYLNLSRWTLAIIACIFLLTGAWVFKTILESRKHITFRTDRIEYRVVGTTGTASTDLTPKGKVHLNNESWTAVTKDRKPILSGDVVEVVKIDGPVITVIRKNN